MRLPTTEERRALQCLLEQASVRGGHGHTPHTAAAEGWLRDFLDTVDACQDWVVDLEREGCAACLGEHPDHAGDPVCAPMEQRGLSMHGHSGVGLAVHRVPTGGQRAPDWCPLREQDDGPATTFLVRGI